METSTDEGATDCIPMATMTSADQEEVSMRQARTQLGREHAMQPTGAEISPAAGLMTIHETPTRQPVTLKTATLATQIPMIEARSVAHVPVAVWKGA